MIGYRNVSVFPEPVPVATSVVSPASDRANRLLLVRAQRRMRDEAGHRLVQDPLRRERRDGRARLERPRQAHKRALSQRRRAGLFEAQQGAHLPVEIDVREGVRRELVAQEVGDDVLGERYRVQRHRVGASGRKRGRSSRLRQTAAGGVSALYRTSHPRGSRRYKLRSTALVGSPKRIVTAACRQTAPSRCTRSTRGGGWRCAPPADLFGPSVRQPAGSNDGRKLRPEGPEALLARRREFIAGDPAQDLRSILDFVVRALAML